MSEGLAQGPYLVARVRFEPATLQMQGTELTTKPPLFGLIASHIDGPNLTEASQETSDERHDIRVKIYIHMLFLHLTSGSLSEY